MWLCNDVAVQLSGDVGVQAHNIDKRDAIQASEDESGKKEAERKVGRVGVTVCGGQCFHVEHRQSSSAETCPLVQAKRADEWFDYKHAPEFPGIGKKAPRPVAPRARA